MPLWTMYSSGIGRRAVVSGAEDICVVQWRLRLCRRLPAHGEPSQFRSTMLFVQVCLGLARWPYVLAYSC